MGSAISSEGGGEADEGMDQSLPKLHSAWEQEKRELEELPARWSELGAACCAARSSGGDSIQSPFSARRPRGKGTSKRGIQLSRMLGDEFAGVAPPPEPLDWQIDMAARSSGHLSRTIDVSAANAAVERTTSAQGRIQERKRRVAEIERGKGGRVRHDAARRVRPMRNTRPDLIVSFDVARQRSWALTNRTSARRRRSQQSTRGIDSGRKERAALLTASKTRLVRAEMLSP
jgi:hypothetical protein